MGDEVTMDTGKTLDALRGAHAPEEIPLDWDAEADSAGRAQLGDGAAGVVVMPNGMRVVDLAKFVDARRVRPRRRKGMADLTNLESFLSHVKRQAGPDTVIWADKDQPALVAVFDYDQAGPDGSAGWRDYRARYLFPFSAEWKAWNDVDGKALGQADFAQFLETHVIDVVDPSSLGDDSSSKKLADTMALKLAGQSTLMTLSRGIAVRADVKVTQARNLQTGESQLSYDETHSTQNADRGGAITVPGAFVIGVPVFDEGDTYAVLVRLRYRLQAGSVVWTMHLHRADRAREIAFTEAVTRVVSETQMPVRQGKPEAAVAAP